MNSLARFKDVMSRCEELVVLYRRQPGKADDILRFVVKTGTPRFAAIHLDQWD